MRYFNFCSTLLVLMAFPACWHNEYDISRGIDKEITLFTDEVSLPIADIGPLSPKQLLGDVDLESTLGGLFKEDRNGYLIVEQEETIYSNTVLQLSMNSPEPTQPMDVHIDNFTGTPGAAAENLAVLGLKPALQDFSLYAVNPLTADVAVSGKVTLSTLSSSAFDKVPVAAKSEGFVFFNVAQDGNNTLDECSLQDMVLHLPASFLEKDPLSGWSSIALGYRYKAQLALGEDFPMTIPIPVDDLDLPLAQYRVKDVLLSTEVSNEIPITFVLESVDVMTADAEGNSVACEDVSITPGLTIASGRMGSPVVSPLTVTIRANEGIIPDIAGLRLNLSVRAPSGDGDKRLNMNQTIYFDKLRATVSGGITIQSL